MARTRATEHPTDRATRWALTLVAVAVSLTVLAIVFGMWGLFLLAPKVHQTIQPWVEARLGWIPLFSGHGSGQDFLLAGVVLAIMILPTITSISRDALLAVPRLEREAAYALGATR